jgi:hypothetical protein
MSLVWGKLHFILKILKSNHIMILYYNFWHSKENCFNISENIVLGNILSQNLYLKKHAYYFYEFDNKRRDYEKFRGRLCFNTCCLLFLNSKLFCYLWTIFQLLNYSSSKVVYASKRRFWILFFFSLKYQDMMRSYFMLV